MIFRELIGGKCLCDATSIILWYIVYVGPWVLGWKSLKPLRKTLRCGCMGLVLPLGMSPKRHRVWLVLGWCPKIVIIILTEYLVEHYIWYIDLLGWAVYRLWKDGREKAKMKPINTCIHIWHDCIFINGYRMFIMHAITCLIQSF